MRLIPIVPAVALTACPGEKSTIREGSALRMGREAAKDVVRGAICAQLDGDRITYPAKLSASGHDPSLTDTQAFNVSAIPVAAKEAFGFEILHHGTLFNGPAKADAIFPSLIERAGLAGQRVSAP